MLVSRTRAWIGASLLAVAACGLPERVSSLLEDEPSEADAVEAIDEAQAADEVGADAEAADPKPPTTAATPEPAGLGATVAGLVPKPGGPAPVPGPLGGDLELVEKIHITRLEAGWTNKPKKTHGAMMGVVFEIDADVTVDPDIGINQARLHAKATCKVGDERRASAAEVISPNATPWGGYDYVNADPGEHEGAWAHLFLQDNVVGRTPCQVEFRLSSPLYDKPLRVGGAWCVRDDGIEAAPCPELAPPPRGSGTKVRDWEFDRMQQTVQLTVQVDERVWLDRDLVLRSACDRGGGERIPRTQYAYGPWGLLDPGDAVRVMLSRYDGWFGEDPPCELTLEWWRHDDRGNRLDPKDAAVACVRKFLPEEGPCGNQSRESKASAAGPLVVRKFDLSIARDPYNRRYQQLVADVEVFAFEDIAGRFNLEARGSCGKGTRRSDVWMSPELNIEPRMLEANEVAIGSMRGWLPTSASACELELMLTPQGTATTVPPTSLGKYCVTRSGAKPC